jgi:hypothetical protein
VVTEKTAEMGRVEEMQPGEEPEEQVSMLGT